MKTLGHLKSYDIQLTVQSPLFIGSGEKLRKKEYLFLPQENKAIILDTEKLIVFLSGELSSQVQHLRMIQLKWCPVT